MKQKKVYIAGKITGQPIHLTTMNFGEAQVKLEEKGYEVINPLQVINDWHLPWQECMKKCIPELLTCDYIYMLPDSRESKGARMEYDIAIALGIELLRI